MNSADIQSEDDQGAEAEREEDPLNWQRLVSRGVLASLTPKEIKRQEVINGESSAFYTLQMGSNIESVSSLNEFIFPSFRAVLH